MGICDKDILQLYYMFSPDFSKHIDVEPINSNWIIRNTFDVETFFEIPSTFLSYNPKMSEQVTQ